MTVPIEKKQLAFHIAMHGAVARFKEVDGGFSLVVHHGDMMYTLHTQRGEVRVFKCLMRAVEFARQHGVKTFGVDLIGAEPWLRDRAPWERPSPTSQRGRALPRREETAFDDD